MGRYLRAYVMQCWSCKAVVLAAALSCLVAASGVVPPPIAGAAPAAYDLYVILPLTGPAAFLGTEENQVYTSFGACARGLSVVVAEDCIWSRDPFATWVARYQLLNQRQSQQPLDEAPCIPAVHAPCPEGSGHAPFCDAAGRRARVAGFPCPSCVWAHSIRRER